MNKHRLQRLALSFDIWYDRVLSTPDNHVVLIHIVLNPLKNEREVVVLDSRSINEGWPNCKN